MINFYAKKIIYFLNNTHHLEIAKIFKLNDIKLELLDWFQEDFLAERRAQSGWQPEGNRGDSRTCRGLQFSDSSVLD